MQSTVQQRCRDTKQISWVGDTKTKDFVARKDDKDGEGGEMVLEIARSKHRVHT